MQKKISKTTSIIVTVAVMLFGVIAAAVGFNIYKNSIESELKSAACVITQEDYTPDKISEVINAAMKYDVRVTFIEENGAVSYDNNADVSELDNHLDREEVYNAFKNGSGDDTRMSDTIGKSTYYYALRYDGGVIRFAIERSSMYPVLLGLVSIMICAAGIIIVIVTIVSMKLADGVIAPINKLVGQINYFEYSDVEISSEYPELIPIAENIRNLSRRLSRYIKRLKREKEKITLVIDSMLEGMILLDEDNNVLTVNKSAVRFLNPDFTLDEEPRSIMELTRNPEILSILKTVASGDCERDAADGIAEIESRHIKVLMSKARYGDKFGIIIILIDETESVMAEKIRREFSANVSHELKTPLTTIKGFGEMLEKGIITDSGDIKKYGGTIFRESERLLLLINDIIRLSQIEESVEITKTKINLFKTALDTAEVLQHKADENDISLEVKGNDVFVCGNESYASELMFNLADNAIKYNNRGGHVLLSVYKEGGDAVIKVRDDGIGIPKEHQQRIFERFYRVDKSRSKERGGTGLGLSIVKHIVYDFKGSVSLESEPGKGTEIKVIIPVK